MPFQIEETYAFKSFEDAQRYAENFEANFGYAYDGRAYVIPAADLPKYGLKPAREGLTHAVRTSRFHSAD